MTRLLKLWPSVKRIANALNDMSLSCSVDNLVLPSTSSSASGVSGWVASRAVSDYYGDDTANELSAGIQEGLYEANARQNELLRKQNDLLTQLLEKDTTVEITANSLMKAMNRKTQRDGKNSLAVSV